MPYPNCLKYKSLLQIHSSLIITYYAIYYQLFKQYFCIYFDICYYIMLSLKLKLGVFKNLKAICYFKYYCQIYLYKSYKIMKNLKLNLLYLNKIAPIKHGYMCMSLLAPLIRELCLNVLYNNPLNLLYFRLHLSISNFTINWYYCFVKSIIFSLYIKFLIPNYICKIPIYLMYLNNG